MMLKKINKRKIMSKKINKAKKCSEKSTKVFNSFCTSFEQVSHKFCTATHLCGMGKNFKIFSLISHKLSKVFKRFDVWIPVRKINFGNEK